MSVPAYWDKGDIPWVSSGDMKTLVLTETGQSITLAAIENSSAPLLPKEAIVVVTRSGILRKYLPVAIMGKPMAINQDLKALVPKAGVVPGFVLHSLIAHGPQILARCLKSGTTVESIEFGWFKRFEIPLPPTQEEQRAIATALSDVDGLLGSLDALIAKKKAIKQGAMQQLLTGKQRLPGFEGEWEVKTMRQLGNVYGGLTGKSKPDFGEGNARYIPFMNIMNGPVIDTSFLDRVCVGPAESQNKAQKGDLFFNGSSETPEEVGMCSMLREDIADLYLNSFSFGFRLTKEMKADGMFLSYWFRSPAGRKAIYSSAQGATRYNLAKSNFNRLEVPYPKPEEQTAIATVLSDMDVELEALAARRAKTALLKQGMMQELLTGRTRLV